MNAFAEQVSCRQHKEISTCSTAKAFTKHHVIQSPSVWFVLRQAHLDARKRWGVCFFFFSLLGKWASLAAVGVSNLGQASYLGWCNENHQCLDVMLETFFTVFCSQMVYVVIRLVIQEVDFQKLLQYFVLKIF